MFPYTKKEVSIHVQGSKFPTNFHFQGSSGWSLSSVQSSEKMRWGGGYLRNQWTYRNGSPIKICRISLGNRWRALMYGYLYRNYAFQPILCSSIWILGIAGWVRMRPLLRGSYHLDYVFTKWICMPVTVMTVQINVVLSVNFFVNRAFGL